MNYSFILILSLALYACTSQPSHSAGTSDVEAVDLTGYETTEINGYTLAERHNEKGVLIDRGFLKNGVKEGAWTRYDGESGVPLVIISWDAGRRLGTAIQMDGAGRMIRSDDHLADQPHGRITQYRRGMPTVISNYKNGALNGPSITYHPNTRIEQKRVDFVDGKMHGKFRYYDEDGNVTVEYEYKNGEKIGGGIQ